jgi:hypothetical protein
MGAAASNKKNMRYWRFVLKEYGNFVVAVLDCPKPLIPKPAPFTHSLTRSLTQPTYYCLAR